MAVRTVVADGVWSAAGTWDTGVPGDGDSFVVPTIYTVTFDVDQSGMSTGMIAGTIDGTLILTTTPGTYYLKMDGVSGHNIVGNGSFLCGSSVSPVPNNVKFTLDLGTNSVVSGNSSTGMTLKWYGTGPTDTYCKIFGATELAGQTVLSVDRDLTSDIWPADGTGVVGITNYPLASSAQNSCEYRTIASGGIAATTLTITSGLTADKLVGSVIYLLNRNLWIKAGTGSGGANFTTFKVELELHSVAFHNNGTKVGSNFHSQHTCAVVIGGKSIMGGNTNTGVLSNCYKVTVQDDVILFDSDRCINGISNTYAAGKFHVIKDRVCIFGCLTLLVNSLNSNQLEIKNDVWIMGVRDVFEGCGEVSGNVVIESCRELLGFGVVRLGRGVIFRRSGTLMRTSCIALLNGALIGGSGNDANSNDYNPGNASGVVIGYGAEFRSGTPVANYLSRLGTVIGGTDPFRSVCIYDVGDGAGNPQPGRINAWCSGGTVDFVLTASAPASPPVDPVFFHRLKYEDVTYMTYVDIPIYGQRSIPLRIDCWMANSASGSYGQLPKVDLIDPTYEPSHPSSIITSATMADNTSWQTLTLTHAPAYDRQLILRVYGARASGITYFNYALTAGSGKSRGVRTGGRL